MWSYIYHFVSTSQILIFSMLENFLWTKDSVRMASNFMYLYYTHLVHLDLSTVIDSDFDGKETDFLWLVKGS